MDLHLLIFGVLFIAIVLVLPGGLVDLVSRFRQWRPSGTRETVA